MEDLQMHNVEYQILFLEQKSLQTYYSWPIEEFMSLQRASSLDDVKNRKQPTAFCHVWLVLSIKKQKNKQNQTPPHTNKKSNA